MNYWPLLGIAVVVAGFVLRLNPVIVVVTAGIVSGLAAGMPLCSILRRNRSGPTQRVRKQSSCPSN